MRRGIAITIVAATLVLGALVGSLGLTFVRADLEVPRTSIPPLPPVAPVEGVSVTVIPTASVASRHGFSVRGASLTAPLANVMVAVLVRHPEGLLLIDAGMSRNGVAHVATVPLLMQAIIELELSQSVAEGLQHEGLAPGDLRGVLLTHSHWDHVSGLEDLPGVPVWITPEELAYARNDEGGALFRQLDEAAPIPVRDLVFDRGPYGPFPRHHDLFGDGSVVAVPMPGHSPGSVGVFVNLPDGQRLLFVGDTAWAEEGVTWPAEKPWLSRRMVDHDPAGVRDQLVRLHQLSAAYPELIVVPAHDDRVLQRLP